MINPEYIYGLNPVLELMRAGRRRCHEIFVSINRKEADAKRVQDEAALHRIPIKYLTRDELTHISHIEKHQGVVARCDSYPYAVFEDVVRAASSDPRKGFLVILDGITDPQNFGSLVRTAHLMGAHGVVIPRDNAVSVTPTVVKTSAGATEYLPIVQVTNIANSISHIKDKGFWVAGADGNSKENIYLHDFRGCNTAIVIGAEGEGIRRLVRERCDYLLSIPMEGAVGSYNASVAGALFMGEVARSRWLQT